MPNTRSEVNEIRAPRCTRIPAAALVLSLALLAASLPGAAAASAVDSLPEADQQCLGCHATEGMKKDLQDGEALSLHVPGEAYAKSVHKANGCGSCHSEVDIKSHPPSKRDIKSLRQYSIERAEACRQCHEEAFKQHERSVHAVRLRQGNPLAPVCTGCHGSHSVTPKTAYETCVGCHAAALDAHGKWLPNAGLHHEVVSCAACHAPAVAADDRSAALRRRRRSSGWRKRRARRSSRSWPARSMPTARGSTRRNCANSSPKSTGMESPRKTLRGRVELRTGVEAHQLSDKADAIKACDSCHRDRRRAVPERDGLDHRTRRQAGALSRAD